MPNPIASIASFIGLLLASASCLTAAPKPNIVYIYADDLGWGYIGANGQTKVKTPNLDRLANTGVNFTRGYGCTVCSPARSSQQTGFHQGHTWTDRNDPDSSKAIRAKDKTIADQLSQVGYRSAYFGKWGYGADQAQNNPDINNPQTLPINHGYDVVLAELHHVRAHTFFQPTLWRSNTSDANPTTALVPNQIPNDPSLPTYPAYQNDPAYPNTAYCDDSYAFGALDFVRTEAQDPSKPFFCLLAFQIPHTPLGQIADLPKWFDEYDDTDTSSWTGNSKQFAAMVTRMDAHIGNLLDALEDPNNDGDKSDSVLENTLIVFASDNGGQRSGGAGDALAEFSGNANLRGAKGAIYEGAIRVPMIMKWQGKLPAGTTSDQVVDVTDMLPTFCEIAGTDIPVGIDGVSLAPTITGVGHQRPRDFIIHEAGGSSSIIRGDHKLVSKNSSRELYNLATDPSESNNIAASNPALADELETLLIGERTKEPDTFANTYHHWTGADNANTSDPDNWSDYAYSNNGTTHLADSGAPRLSWNATMENTSGSDRTATADANIETLGIEIRGTTNTQILDLANHTLTGRNEIRLAANSKVLLDNGTLDSLRWVDLFDNATIAGSGTITGTLYHAGALEISPSSPSTTPAPGAELIQNGGFENGPGTGDYSYTELEDWTTDGPSPENDGSKASNPKSGTHRGLIQGSNNSSNLVQNTGATIALNDSFTLSFWHRGFNGWNTGEQIQARLFYLDGANRVTIYQSDIALTSGTWNQFTANIPAITDNNAVGKEIRISITPTNNASGFASLDDVSLTKNSGATTIPGQNKLTIAKNYRAETTARTNLTIAGKDNPGIDHSQLLITGDAHIDGSLALTIDPGFTPSVGDTFTILTANAVQGRYRHADDIIAADGHHFKITYNDQSITLKKIATTPNGTPHTWLENNNLLNGETHQTADLADFDKDGVPNWQEWIAGTDPTSRASFTAPSIQPRQPDNTLTWEMLPDRLYYIESSQDLVTFTPHAGPFAGNNPNHTFQLSQTTAPNQFYKLRIERM